MVDIVEPVVVTRVGTDITEDSMKVHNRDLGQSAKRGQFETVLADGEILIPKAGLPENELLNLDLLADVDTTGRDNEMTLEWNDAAGELQAKFRDHIIPFSTVSDSSIITDTTVQTSFDLGITLPANTLRAGSHLAICIAGLVRRNGTDRVVIRVKIGGTTIYMSESFDAGNAGDIAWNIHLDVVARSTTTERTTQKAAQYGSTLMVPPVPGSPGAVTWTGSNSITATAQWDNASTGNRILLQQFWANVARANLN